MRTWATALFLSLLGISAYGASTDGPCDLLLSIAPVGSGKYPSLRVERLSNPPRVRVVVARISRALEIDFDTMNVTPTAEHGQPMSTVGEYGADDKSLARARVDYLLPDLLAELSSVGTLRIGRNNGPFATLTALGGVTGPIFYQFDLPDDVDVRERLQTLHGSLAVAYDGRLQVRTQDMGVALALIRTVIDEVWPLYPYVMDITVKDDGGPRGMGESAELYANFVRQSDGLSLRFPERKTRVTAYRTKSSPRTIVIRAPRGPEVREVLASFSRSEVIGFEEGGNVVISPKTARGAGEVLARLAAAFQRKGKG